MDVKLRVLAGKHVGKEIPLARPKFLIGRAEDCHLRAGSDLISRHHCVISVGDREVTIKDFGSRNGTVVNEETISGETALRTGDRLRVGPLEFEVVVVQAAAKPAPSIKPLASAAAQTAAQNRSVEDSISDWLGPPDATSSSRAMLETQTIKIGQTEQIEVAPSADGEATDPKGKKEPGKLPPIPQAPKAKDSREAAANILRELSKRR